MKKIRTVFLLAALAFTGMAVCLFLFFLTPAPGNGGALGAGAAAELREIQIGREKEKEKSIPVGAGGEEGDPGEPDAYWELIDAILAYEEKYNVDMYRYDGMTAEETLQALKAEYGELEK